MMRVGFAQWVVAFALAGLFMAAEPGNLHAAGEEIFRVQLGRHDTQRAAQDQADALSQQGHDVNVLPSDGTWIVALGTYNTYADAYVDSMLLREEYGSFVIREPRVGEVTFAPSPTAIRAVKDAPGAAARSSYISDSPTGAALRQRASGRIAEGRYVDAELDLRESMGRLSNDDPAKGWASMRLGYLEHRRGNLDMSRAYFTRVASGDFAATPFEKAEALQRLGAIAHSQKDRAGAWRLFRQMYHEAADVSQKSEAALQLAGLNMELARSAKGTLEETRQFIQEQLQWIPESERRIRARMELMHLETRYFERDYQGCVDEAEPFLAKYGWDPKLETATARLWYAFSLSETGRYLDGVEVFWDVINQDFQPGEGWAVMRDPRIRAAEFARIAAARSKRPSDEIAFWKDLAVELQNGGGR
jgi:hypothetical protein